MALSWTEPREFETGKALPASQMNEISDNMRYLFTRPQKVATIRGTGVNYTTLGTSFADIDASALGFTLETGGGNLEINLLGTVSNTVINTLTCFDVYMDGTTYLSSLTGTPLTNGIWQQKTTVAGSIDSIKATPYRLVVGDVPAGVHTFVLRWRVSAGTSTLYVAAGNLVQFSVVEHA